MRLKRFEGKTMGANDSPDALLAYCGDLRIRRQRINAPTERMKCTTNPNVPATAIAMRGP